MSIKMEEVRDLISKMRIIGSDTQTCEVKEAGKSLPENLLETISAFANKEGGLIILGLSEKKSFRPVEGFDVQRIYSALLGVGDKLTPRCRLEAEVLPFEGTHIIVAQVPAIGYKERPCYVTSKGVYLGSYIRTGDGDRRLTQYEIDRLREEHTQPKFDIEAVTEASIEELNEQVLNAIVARHRLLTPRYFGKMKTQDILIKLGVLRNVQGVIHPTIAGLLVAGEFPQQYFPRLNVTFTVYPGTTKAQSAGQPYRYLDSKTIDGSIPEIVLDAVAMLKKNMRTGALIEESLREEVTDYPILAFREALVNALQHRDYSPDGRGSQVQVNLFSDRLEILNPGGLYGAASIESMSPGISATRNVNLSRLLESTPSLDGVGNGQFVIENRGTGLLQIQDSLTQALMPPARIVDHISAFSITFFKCKLTDDERSLTRWENVELALVRELGKKGSLSIAEITQASGMNRRTISKYLNRLVDEGVVERTEPLRSPKQRYLLKSDAS